MVLHGWSDLPDEVVREAIRSGIRKFNVETDLRVTHARSLKRMFDSVGDVSASRALAAPATAGMPCASQQRNLLPGCRTNLQ